MNAVKPPGACLQLAHPEQVLDPVRVALAQAVHHGDRRLHPLSVRFLLDAEPLLGLRLLLGDALADLVHQDLAAAARNAVEPGRLQLPDDLGHRKVEPLAEEHDLAGARSRGCGSDGCA